MIVQSGYNGAKVLFFCLKRSVDFLPVMLEISYFVPFAEKKLRQSDVIRYKVRTIKHSFYNNIV